MSSADCGTPRLRDPALFREAVPVAGRWIEASAEAEPILSPATGAPLGRVPRLGDEAAHAAIAAANTPMVTALLDSARINGRRHRLARQVSAYWYRSRRSTRSSFLAIVIARRYARSSLGPVAHGR